MASLDSGSPPDTNITRGRGSSIRCPKCGYHNKISSEQALKGFICSGCGEQIGGRSGGGNPEPSPDPAPSTPFGIILCPKCGKDTDLQIVLGHDGKSHFRCGRCQTEW